ncbi:hypothetical protein BH09BAC1_BH09BAC1_23540 [soil metagenome]
MTKPKEYNDFKTVDFMREAREKLSEQYRNNPDGFKKDLTIAIADFMSLRKQSSSNEKRKRA